MLSKCPGLILKTSNFDKFSCDPFLEDVPLVQFMYLVFTSCQMRVTVGDSGLCCCACVTTFEAN